MADSTTNITQLSSSQASKEVTVNALVDAASPALLYGRNAFTTTGLTWGYYGGRYNSTSIANGTVALSASQANYVVAARSGGAVSVSTAATNWDDSANYLRLYKVTTGASTVTSYEDHRTGGGVSKDMLDKKASLAGTAPFTVAQTISLNGGAIPSPQTDTALHLAGADTKANRFFLDAFGNFTSFQGRRSNGTAASPSALALNDPILSFGCSGYGATSYSATSRAYFNFHAAEGWTDSAQGTYLKIGLTVAGGTSTGDQYIFRTTELTPATDNTRTLGSSSLRWSTVYAATGTINTSDAREKTAVAPMTLAEIAAAKAIGQEIGTYKFLASVAAKGDAARFHVGLTVQRAIEIMEQNGLDPMRYGFICYDAWPEMSEVVESWDAQPQIIDDFGNLVQEALEAGRRVVQEYRPAGDRYSFRYDQLNLFISRGFEARLAALEASL